jgi:excisionase family DNA binding protein
MPNPPKVAEPPKQPGQPEASDEPWDVTPRMARRIFKALTGVPVSPSTLDRWAAAGRITFRRTLGGHRRYRESEVRALAEGPRQAVA